jgi:hypothetical protein
MASDDTGADRESGDSAPATAASSPLAKLSSTEQLMGLGALLIIVIADIIGNIFVDEYSISRVTWIVAVAAVAAIWVHGMAGRDLPVAYRPTLVILGYGSLLLGVREFLSDVESDVLGGSNVIFAIATYVGAVLLGYGAYRLGRSD